MSVFAPAYARELPAGFAPGTLWLSKESAQVGETLTVSTVLYDASDQPISGTLFFLVNGAALTQIPFTENPGESRIFQASWKASAGEHTFTARVTGTNSVALALATSTAAHLSVIAPVSFAQGTPVSVPDATKNALTAFGIASSSPALAHVAVAAASSSEGVRTAVVGALSNALGISTSTPAGKIGSDTSTTTGNVLGAQIERADDSARSKTTPHQSWYTALWRGALGTLLTIARSAALWYPFLAIVIFALLFLLFKRLRHPKK